MFGEAQTRITAPTITAMDAHLRTTPALCAITTRFRLSMSQHTGPELFLGKRLGVTATGDDAPEEPDTISLYAPSSNPSQGPWAVSFYLTGPGDLHLGVYDVTVRQVRGLACRHYESGQHSMAWDGLDDRGNPVPTGVYFVKLAINGTSHGRPITVLR